MLLGGSRQTPFSQSRKSMYNDLDEKVDLNPDIKRSDLYDSIEQLKSSELHSVHKDTAQKFLHLTNLIENIRSVNRYG